MITIVDYGYGNIFSILSAFNKIGYSCKVSDQKDDILNSSIIVLPGVGSFKQAMRSLENKELDKIIIQAVSESKNIIGICLGYQMLFNKSNEFGIHDGLGLIKGEVNTLESIGEGAKRIPNVGWRTLTVNNENNIIKEIYNYKMFYFVHSFVPVVENEIEVSSFIKFNNIKIHASVHYKNIVGFQFHPEKSGEIGLSLLKDSIQYLLKKIK